METGHGAPRRAVEEITLTTLEAFALAITLAAAPSAAPSPAKYTRNVAVVLYDGVEILDFAGPLEVFGAAARFGGAAGAAPRGREVATRFRAQRALSST